MRKPSGPSSRLALGLACAAALAGCSTVDGWGRKVADSVTPYRVEVVQGNFVSREQVELLKPGMGRQQVRDLLGTPLVTSLFHADRWDYVFTMRRQGVEPQRRHLVVHFKGDVLERFEGDPMPSENEFVASLGKRSSAAKAPPLEATPEQLQRAAASRQAAPATATPAPATATAYPPLEPAGR